MNVAEEISRRRVPCGPVTVAVEGVCRRRLKDIYDSLLDRLSTETSQEFQPPEAPKDHEIRDGKVIHKDVIAKNEKAAKTMQAGKAKARKEREKAAAEPSPAEKKKQMIEDAKTKVDVKMAAKEYEEKLMGNSKLLQDPTGKIKKH